MKKVLLTLVLALTLAVGLAQHSKEDYKMVKYLTDNGLINYLDPKSCTVYVHESVWNSQTIDSREKIAAFAARWMQEDNLLTGAMAEDIFWQFTYVEDTDTGRKLSTWTESIGLEVYVYGIWGTVESTTCWHRGEDGKIYRVEF